MGIPVVRPGAPASDDRRDPVAFDGPDLGRGRRRYRLVARGELIESILSADLTVAYLGFAPGFAYVTGLAGPLAAWNADRHRGRRFRPGLSGSQAAISASTPSPAPVDGIWSVTPMPSCSIPEHLRIRRSRRATP